jgi:multidrug efflux pump subunit AcrA (membrane-fusion protein)
MTTPPPAPLFRSEALEAMAAARAPGALLALSPRWIDHTYRILVAALAAGAIFAFAFQTGEYARGPAVVRVEGGLDLTAAAGGIIMTIDVRAGDRVEAGQPLVRFHTERERQELESLDREFELKLVRTLLRPNDEATRLSLGSLRAARELAAARLEERVVRAPRAGVVRNLRIRPGQLLASGDTLLTLVDESAATFRVLAVLPGALRPMLRPGMPLRFELEGYPQATSDLRVERVDDEVVGPSEVRRYLGRELGDAFPTEGSMVLVHARMAQRSFAFEGTRYPLYDGIPGHVEVRLRRVPLVALLFPIFKGRLRHGQ